MTKDSRLDKEESALLQAFELGELVRVDSWKGEKKPLEEAAEQFFKKDQRINIRISSNDLAKLRKKAATEGIPYQTLISGTLHKFVTGQLKPVT